MLLVSKVVVLGDNIKLNRWRKKKENEQPPMEAFDCGFLTPENADTFPILFCRNNRHCQTGATGCQRKGPTAHFIPLLVDFIKDLDFRRIILKCENELSMKIFQEAMIHSCVEVAVREMKRQCKILRISAEHNTIVRITDDISLLNWIPHFAMQCLNKMRTGRRWRKANGAIWREKIGFIKLEKKESAHS